MNATSMSVRIFCLGGLIVVGGIVESSDYQDKKTSSAIEYEASRSFSGDSDSVRELGAKFLVKYDGNPAAAGVTNSICQRNKVNYPHFSWAAIESSRAWLVLGRVCMRHVKESQKREILIAELRKLGLELIKSDIASDRAEAAITLGVVAQPKDFELLKQLASNNNDQTATGAVIALHTMGQRLNHDYLADAIPSIKNDRARAMAREVRRQASTQSSPASK